MSKKNAKSRFVSAVHYDDGRSWQHSVPPYIGKLSVGDLVVVGDIRSNGSYTIAQITSVDARAEHRQENIWPIVDKVRTKRWCRHIKKGAAKAQLMNDMAKRQSELDALSRYRESAKGDSEMKSLLREYKAI